MGSVNTLQPKGSFWYQYVGIKDLNWIISKVTLLLYLTFLKLRVKTLIKLYNFVGQLLT